MLDAFFEIGKWSDDKGKIYITMTSKLLDTLKYKFIYHERININAIKKLSYFDNFEFVIIKDVLDMRQQHTKYVYFNADTNEIPPFVTHLELDEIFDESIKNSIPSSVTHLTFGYCFNKSIKNSIPSSVT